MKRGFQSSDSSKNLTSEFCFELIYSALVTTKESTIRFSEDDLFDHSGECITLKNTPFKRYVSPNEVKKFTGD